MKSKHGLAAQLLQVCGLTERDIERLIRNMADVKARHLPDVPLSVLDESFIYYLGMKEYMRQHLSVSMAKAYVLYSKEKLYLRKRTYWESLTYVKRAVKALPRGEQGLVREVTSEECAAMLKQEFTTPSTRNKAIRWLNNFFAVAVRNQWCSDNPISRIPRERLQERKIEPLTIHQVYAFLEVLRQPKFRPCVAAFGLMLWAGIRPFEVGRLSWREVDLNERVIYVEPRHSKTGGARQVTMHPVLFRVLCYVCKTLRPDESQMIVPRRWGHLWRLLRKQAGFDQWVPDTLRHTFASYHLKHFRNMDELQWEMGHRDKEMLFTRYLNMRNITQKDATAFWNIPLEAFCVSGRKKPISSVCIPSVLGR